MAGPAQAQQFLGGGKNAQRPASPHTMGTRELSTPHSPLECHKKWESDKYECNQ
jgi:hypothetical protein